MTPLAFVTFISCAMILWFCVWAALSQTVRDWLGLKIFLGITAISAYVVMANPTERAYAFLVISIAGACAGAMFQQRILRRRLFHRANEKTDARCTRRNVRAA